MSAKFRVIFALLSCATLLAISNHEVNAASVARSYGAGGLEPNAGTRAGESTNDANAHQRRPLSLEEDGDDKRVFGGVPVDPPFKYPFLVNLVRFNLLEFCGGSLISPTVVMTAAHCNKNGGEYIWIGRHDLSDPNEWDKDSQSFKVVDRAFSTQKYIGSANYHDNDIMLLLLDRPVDTAKWPPILLDDGPITEEVEAEGILVTVMGWGATEFSGGFGVEIPREVTVSGIPPEICNGPAMYNNILSRNMICAADFGQDACQGDSGGPLIAHPVDQATRPEIATDEPVLVGVVSWGIGCAGLEVDLQEGEDTSAQRGYPGIYTRVANYKGWVTAQLEAWESEPARFLSDQQKKPKVEPAITIPGEPDLPCGGKRFFIDKDVNGVCATSKDASGKCMNKGGYSMSQAQEMCDALGARLCTLDELKAKEARATGCGLDSKLIYTSTPCRSGGLMLGAGGNGGESSCSAPGQPQVDGVRCCV